MNSAETGDPAKNMPPADNKRPIQDLVDLHGTFRGSFPQRDMPLVQELEFWGDVLHRGTIKVEFYDGLIFRESRLYIAKLQETIERMINKIEKGLHWSAQIDGKDVLKAIDDAVRPQFPTDSENDE